MIACKQCGSALPIGGEEQIKCPHCGTINVMRYRKTQCPSCSAEILLWMGEATKSYGCPQCKKVINVEDNTVLESNVEVVTPPTPIGSIFQWQGTSYRIVGYMEERYVNPEKGSQFRMYCYLAYDEETQKDYLRIYSPFPKEVIDIPELKNLDNKIIVLTLTEHQTWDVLDMNSAPERRILNADDLFTRYEDTDYWYESEVERRKKPDTVDYTPIFEGYTKPERIAGELPFLPKNFYRGSTWVFAESTFYSDADDSFEESKSNEIILFTTEHLFVKEKSYLPVVYAQQGRYLGTTKENDGNPAFPTTQHQVEPYSKIMDDPNSWIVWSYEDYKAQQQAQATGGCLSVLLLIVLSLIGLLIL